MKRRFSLILSAILALAIVAAIPFAVAASDKTDIGSVETGYTPEGIAVNNADDFAAMDANGTYYLANDITISATYAADFTGTLDGNGKTVTVSAPLFKNLKGTVKNLKLAGEVAVSDYDAGALAQRAENATVTNVLNNASVKGSMTAIEGAYTHKNVADTAEGKVLADTMKHAGTGGLIGSASGVCAFTDCLNLGNVNGSPAGGIVGVMGYDPDAASFTFVNCHNEGALTDEGTDATNLPAVGTSVNGGVGGIAGLVFDAKTVSFNACSNKGEINSTGLAGGVLAFYTRASNTNTNEATLTLESCTNAGKINTANYSGGILGIADNSVKLVTVDGCENTADIIGTAGRLSGIVGQSYDVVIKNSVNSGNVSGTLHLGGLIGRAFASATFENCKNSGNVTGSYEHTSTKGAVGGLGGYMNVAATAKNCENTGTITCLKANAIGGIFGNVNKGVVVENCKNSAAISGQYYVGGIVGDSVVEATATNCENTGVVEASGKIAGGIVGWARTTLTATNNKNSGKVTSGDYGAGGLVGRLDADSNVDGFENSGEIATTTYGAGGVLGLINSGTAYTVANCVNTGNVNGTTGYAGGIIGYTKAGATLTSCLNTGDISGKNDVGGIVGYFNKDAKDAVETMIRCGNTGNITAIEDDAGGFAGYVLGSNGATTMKYCFNTGNVTAPEYVGGAIGYINTSVGVSASFCYFSGVYTATGEGKKSAVIETSNNATPPAANQGNIYYVEGCADFESYYPSATAVASVALNPNTTAAAIASGELAYTLNAAIKAADPTITADVFYQTLGTDTHPVLDNTHKVVIKNADGSYANATAPVTPPEVTTPGGDNTTTEPDVTTTVPDVTTTVPDVTTTVPDVTTTVPGGDVTTTEPVDTTTAETPADTTTSPVDTTTAETPVDTTKKPADTTTEPEKKGCGGFAFAAQLVALLGTALTVVVIKKKA